MRICNTSIMFFNNNKIESIRKSNQGRISTHDLLRVKDLRYVKMNEMI